MGEPKRDVIPGVDRRIDHATKALQLINNSHKTQVVAPIVLGLDISTSVVGVCGINANDKKTVEVFDSIVLHTKTKALAVEQKADMFRERLEYLVQGKLVVGVYIEEPLKAFMPGMSSASTLTLLARFNGICSYIVYKMFGDNPVNMLNVSHARSLVGISIDRKNKAATTKEKVRTAVIAAYPQLPLRSHVATTGKSKGQVVVDKDMEDCIDAFVIAMAGCYSTTT